MAIFFRSYLLFAFALGFFVVSGCSSTESLDQPTDTDKTLASQQADSKQGMWLPSQLEATRYQKMKKDGLSLPKKTIYNPDTSSLSQAIVRININGELGGTGSFVSEKGLLLTSHDIISNSITINNSGDQNYNKKGFYAKSMANEIPIPNFNVYILLEQKEVTEQINSQLPDTLSYQQRFRKERQVRQQLIAKRKRANTDLVVQINDFWSGNRQFMSVYKVIRDVRLVHTPPISIGSGEREDKKKQNWPSYAGNYAFLRAYVAPDGSSRPHNSKNVAFNPARHLTINSGGVDSGDFTMSLGYYNPTVRHESSYALDFYHNYRNPILIDSYRAMLAGLKHAAAQDSQAAAQNAAQRRSTTQTLRYYQDVQQGIDNFNVIEQKQRIEKDFEAWVKKDSLRNLRYRRVLPQLKQAYSIASQTGDMLYVTVFTLNNNRLFEIANLYHSYRQVLEDSTQQNVGQAYTDSLLSRHQSLLNDMNLDAQTTMLSQMIHMLATLPEGKVMFHFIELFGDAKSNSLKKEIDQYLTRQQQQSIIYNFDSAKAYMNLPIDSARAQPVDDIVKLYRKLLENYRFARQNYVQHAAYERTAQKRFVEGMQKFRPEFAEYPDGNQTLRITTGRVSGFTRSDSLTYQASTNIETAIAQGNAPASFEDSLKQAAMNELNVNFLSTNDISNRSSGSPVLNRKGELVGLNFDGNAASALSDYLFNPNSRAINLDIRYMLLLLEKKFEANCILDEL